MLKLPVQCWVACRLANFLFKIMHSIALHYLLNMCHCLTLVSDYPLTCNTAALVKTSGPSINISTLWQPWCMLFGDSSSQNNRLLLTESWLSNYWMKKVELFSYCTFCSVGVILQEVCDDDKGCGDEGMPALLRRPKSLQWLQIPVRYLANGHISDAVVWPTKQVHAAQGLYIFRYLPVTAVLYLLIVLMVAAEIVRDTYNRFRGHFAGFPQLGTSLVPNTLLKISEAEVVIGWYSHWCPTNSVKVLKEFTV